MQPLARQSGLSILGTLDDRVGGAYDPEGCAVAPAPETSSVDLPTRKSALPTKKAAPAPCPLFWPSVWGRVFGQRADNHYHAFADPRASGDMGGFQGGVDLLRGPIIPGGHDRAGLYGAYGNVNSDVTGLVTNPAATAYILTHTGAMSLTPGRQAATGPMSGSAAGTSTPSCKEPGMAARPAPISPSLNTNGTGFTPPWRAAIPSSCRNSARASRSSRRSNSVAEGLVPTRL